MNNKKQKVLLAVWVAVVVIIRILYLFLKQQAIVDTYGFFTNAMIQAQEKEPILTSGLTYAYTQNLSALLRFFGNTIEIIPAYQMVLQVFWVILFFTGVILLWGKIAGFVTSSILAFSPIVLSTATWISAENYYMLYFSFLLFLMGVFYRYTARSGWHRSNACEIILMLIGFLLGVICIWNYISWLLIPVIIYILLKNRRTMKDKFWLESYDKELKEKEQLMPVSTQTIIVFLGILTGMFVTLMKYTGLTGWNIVEQFTWWYKQYSDLPNYCQGINFGVTIRLIAALTVGVISQCISNKVIENRLRNKTIIAMQEIQKDLKKVEPKKVKMLHNPLPVPPKHVAKKMDFDFSDLNNELADFDIQDLGINDDFEIS